MATTTTAGIDDGLQQAAAVLAALGPGEVARLTSALGPDARRALEAARRSPGGLSAHDRRRLLASVAQACRARRPPAGRVSDAGTRPGGPGADTDLLPCLAPPGPPFAFMDDLAPAEVAALLGRERPGVIALVMAHASEAVARSAPAALPAEIRNEVALALPAVRRPAPGVLRRVGEALEEELERQRQERRRRRRTARRLAAAVVTGDETLAQQVLEELARNAPAMFEAVAQELAPAWEIPAQAPEDERSSPV